MGKASPFFANLQATHANRAVTFIFATWSSAWLMFYISVYCLSDHQRSPIQDSKFLKHQKNPPKAPKSPNSQLMHLLCVLIFFQKEAGRGPHWSQYRQHQWDWRLPCFHRSSSIFAMGYMAEVAMQVKEAFPGKEIWSCLPSLPM